MEINEEVNNGQEEVNITPDDVKKPLWKKLLTIAKWVAISLVALMLIISGLVYVFKEDIKKYAVSEMNKYLNKEVKVGHIDVGIWKNFPHVSLSFDDVLVYSQFDTIVTADTAIYIQRLDMNFNLRDFLRKQYTVKSIDANNGQVNLAVRKDGKVNYDFIKPKEEDDKGDSPFEFNLKKINLNDVWFSYDNQSSQQYYSGFFNDLTLKGSFNEKVFLMDAKTDFKIAKIKNQALTLIENQSAKCKISIQMDQLNNSFEIKSANLTINKLPFTIKGKVIGDYIDFYVGAKNIKLADFANNFSLNELETVKKIKGKGDVNFDLYVKSGESKDDPLSIHATFGISKGSLSDKNFDISNINVEGSYTSGIDGKKEELKLPKIEFFTLNKPFKGQIEITDFDKPHLVGNAHGIVDLYALHRLFGPFSMDELAGNIEIDGDFDLRFNNLENDIMDISIYDVKSNLIFHNVSSQFIGDSRRIKMSYGQVGVNNQFIKLDSINLSLNSSSLVLNGEINNVSDYLLGLKKLSIKADVMSPSLNIEDLSSTLTEENLEELEEKEKIVDWLLPNDITGSISTNLKRVEYGGHVYTNIKGIMSFGEHSISFRDFEGVTSDAKVTGTLSITETSPMMLVLETNLSSDNINFKSLFTEWGNFDQEVILSENINGNAIVSIYLKAPYDLIQGEIIKDEVEVVSKVKFKNGELKNVETFKEITSSLRQTSAKLIISKSKINAFEQKLLNLQFDEFENEIYIKNGMLTIPSMTIKSNAIDLTLSGTHSFDNEINYSFSFRFREVYGAKDEEFGDIIDDETGFRVFLKMTGTIDNPEFSWDKEASKANRDEINQEIKDDFRSILRDGFGIGKNDSTVKPYEGEKWQEDRIIIDFGNDEEEEEVVPKKKNKIGKKVNEWEKDKKENETPMFEFE